MGDSKAQVPRHHHGPETNARGDVPPPMQAHDPEFEELFRHVPVGFHETDADGLIICANRAALDLLGYAREDYIGRHITEFFAEPQEAGDLFDGLKRGSSVRDCPAALRTRSGPTKAVRITATAVFRDGCFAGSRCVTVEAAKDARPASGPDTDVFRRVLDALPAAIYITDTSGNITYSNDAAEKLAGREPQIGTDKWCVSYRLFWPDGSEMPADQCPMAVALRENRPVRGVEALARRPDGELVPFLPFPTPLRDADGALIGAVNLLVDISERKQAESYQRMLLDELNHRIKNNMQMLHGLLLAAIHESDSTEARAVLSDVGQRVGAMASAQRLLYNASSPRCFPMDDFLHEVCTGAQQAFPPDTTIRVGSDAGQLPNDIAVPLALVLNELLINAARHGTGARGAADISVTLQQEDDQLELVVEDDGPGFDLEAPRRRSSGHGLVLGLSRQLGGTFVVERGTAKGGMGTRCTVKFPARRITLT